MSATFTRSSPHKVGQWVAISTPNHDGLGYVDFHEGAAVKIVEVRDVAVSPLYSGLPYFRSGSNRDTEYQIQRTVLEDNIDTISTPKVPSQYVHHLSLSMTPGGPAHPAMFGVKTRVFILKEVVFDIGSKTYKIPKGTPAYIANEGTSRSGGRILARDPSGWYYQLQFNIKTPTPKVSDCPVWVHYDRLASLSPGVQPKVPSYGQQAYV